jgi:hypothetical protein
MTVEEFDDLKLGENNNVQITMNDGKHLNVELYSGNAYGGRGEYVNYLTQEVVQAEPPKILIKGNIVNGFAEFIFLDDVAKVKLLK